MLFLCPFGGEILRKLKNYKPTKFKAKDSYYDKAYADFAVAFIESLWAYGLAGTDYYPPLIDKETYKKKKRER